VQTGWVIHTRIPRNDGQTIAGTPISMEVATDRYELWSGDDISGNWGTTWIDVVRYSHVCVSSDYPLGSKI